MPTQVQTRRGTTAQHTTFTGAAGELTVDTDKKTVVVHDGTTAGGAPTMREDGSNSALALGSASAPSLKFTGDTNTGVFSPGADRWAVATGGSQRVEVDASGRVLVGTSTATNNLRLDLKLAVVSTGSGNYGGSAFTGYGGTAAGTAPVLDLQRSRGTTDGSMTAVASGDALGYIVFRGSDGTAFTNGAYIQADVDGTVSTGTVPGRLTVYTVNTSGTTAERIRIDSSGNLIVAGITPGATGSIALRGDGLLQSKPVYGFAVSLSTRAMYMDADGFLGYITSVRESKANIEAQSNVDWLYQLEPVSFNYKTKDRETGEYIGVDPQPQFGLIAEDVEAVCPELCFYDQTESGKELRGVQYEKLITPMLKALQQANQRIEALEAEVTALKAQ